jgi:hypothetical protein
MNDENPGKQRSVVCYCDEVFNCTGRCSSLSGFSCRATESSIDE